MLSSLHALPSNFTSYHKSSFISSSRRKSLACVAFSLPINNAVGEESRWLREEQRWLRKEQRWLREEQRWKDEREVLLHEICNLKIKIQELERINSLQGGSLPETVARITKLLQEGDLGKNVGRIAESGSSALALVIDPTSRSNEIVIEELISIPNKIEPIKRREKLQKGAEGDDVQAMQEALQSLGFYSGEEDMEYCSFSSGTERAVKTWQATIGEPENGIMTVELLDKLFKTSRSLAQDGEKDDSSKIIKTALKEHTITTKEEDITEFDASQGRVFLLGENRWEEPSRLNQARSAKKTTATVGSNCINCRGEGRVLCMECDGTGEPNLEPQFLEWVDEGTKCPYCDGLGYTKCDSCDSMIR